ncbi:hypothetical protein A7U60_g7489 [Sanghuangporus baumii]|uniref:Uncharacterized protein n=1 Tax=Sanghuangporus baumii TaxID=108892 RepID=A0A9Q5HT29_SANBA|nr:hypothetical protein A7U60_g7489 [Sanghuangporus baumii]
MGKSARKFGADVCSSLGDLKDREWKKKARHLKLTRRIGKLPKAVLACAIGGNARGLLQDCNDAQTSLKRHLN